MGTNIIEIIVIFMRKGLRRIRPLNEEYIPSKNVTLYISGTNSLSLNCSTMKGLLGENCSGNIRLSI